MTKTQKKNIHKWIKALKSGKFKRGKNCLYEKGKYCCLGVAARAVFNLSIEKIVKLKHNPKDKHDGEDFNSMLSPYLAKRVGLNQEDQIILSDLNDNGTSFKAIAKILQTALDKNCSISKALIDIYFK